MTAIFVGGEGIALNGTTRVVAVAAPASSKQREVLSCLIWNKDTKDHKYTPTINKGGVFNDLEPVVIQPGEVKQAINGCVVLDATDESYEISYEANLTTTESIIASVSTFEVP